MKKRLEAWAVFNTGEDDPWLDTFADAKSATEAAVQWGEDGYGPQSVVRLVECGPDEVVVPKSAAAVVRAAIAVVKGYADRRLGRPARYAKLKRAVERMQKGGKR